MRLHGWDGMWAGAPRVSHSPRVVAADHAQLRLVFTNRSDFRCQAGCVAHSLAGSPVHELENRTVVPLLHPGLHNLPFGMALELRNAAAVPDIEQRSKEFQNFFELHFVLDGQGTLRQANGRQESLQAGDTVLMSLGAAACGAAAPAASQRSSGAPWSLASLVVYIPRSLVDAVHGTDGSNNGEPSSNGSEQMARFVEGMWGPSSGASSGLPQEAVDAILTGARDVASRVLHGGNLARDAEASAAASWWAALSLAVAAALGQVLQGVDSPVKRTLQDLTAFRLPNQTNRLALVFDPFAQPQVPFVFGVEIFEPWHRTQPHVHPSAHELFFILSGSGEGFCDGRRFPVAAGDVVVFRPGSAHGIDNGGAAKMYCLEFMLPDEAFAELVRAGQPSGGLGADDLCVLARIGCS